MSKYVIIIIIAAITLAAPFVAYFMSPADVDADSHIRFIIEKGHGARDIAQLLNSQKLIKSPTLFFLYSVVSGSAHSLKAGEYYLSQAMSLPTITKALVRGPIEDISIIVREGDKLADIEDKLVEAGVLKKGELMNFPGKSLEGFLFPDTYRFFPNSEPEDVVKRFLTNFYSQAMPILSDAENVYDALIIASIIEKEVPFLEDRYIVAGVLENRLSIGMALQVDAAPDTYKYTGLPPTPIANPGKEAMLAAVNPSTTEYWYYLSNPENKETIFSETFEEHKKNKRIYLR